ncbi:MAG: hypothetical protein GOU97_03570 [Nanoarchaeota archaeon]|nr:hypothetical protein [Nanoarchaeota archaeon]
MVRITKDTISSIAPKGLEKEQVEFIADLILAGAGHRKDLTSLVHGMGLILEEKEDLPYKITGSVKIGEDEIPFQIPLIEDSIIDQFQDCGELFRTKQAYESDLKAFTEMYKKKIMKKIPELPCTVTDVSVDDACVESIFRGEPIPGLEELLGGDFVEKERMQIRQERGKDYQRSIGEIDRLETKKNEALEELPEKGITGIIDTLLPYVPVAGPPEETISGAPETPIVRTRGSENPETGSPEPSRTVPQDLKRPSDSIQESIPPSGGDRGLKMPLSDDQFKKMISLEDRLKVMGNLDFEAQRDIPLNGIFASGDRGKFFTVNTLGERIESGVFGAYIAALASASGASDAKKNIMMRMAMSDEAKAQYIRDLQTNPEDLLLSEATDISLINDAAQLARDAFEAELKANFYDPVTGVDDFVDYRQRIVEGTLSLQAGKELELYKRMFP